MLPSLECCTPFKPQEVILDLELSNSDKKIAKMIHRQYYINEIATAGPGYGFNKYGEHILNGGPNTMIRYEVNGNSFIWLFN